MPVVTVTAPPLVTRAAELSALGDVATAIADALGLEPEQVYVAMCPVRAGVLGPDEVVPWPIVELRGGRREASAMAAARQAARAAVSEAWACQPDQVWVQWLPLTPGKPDAG